VYRITTVVAPAHGTEKNELRSILANRATISKRADD
jgi:hypothetical protein